MSEESTPSEIPIEQTIKHILLEKRQTPDWLENMFVDVHLELTGGYPQEPIKEKKVYQTIRDFSQMTPEQISDLDKDQLGLTLSLLETENQDDLVRRLPINLVKDFWDFIRHYERMNGIDEDGDQVDDI